MSTNPSFEIPPEMRDFAEKSMTQARQAFDGFVTAARQAAQHAQEQATSAQAGAKDMAQLAMGYAEKNIASSFEFAQKLIHAKDPRDVMGLHADYIRQQMEALSKQAKELGERTAKIASGKG